MSTLRVGSLEAPGGTGTITVPANNTLTQTGAILQVVSATKTDTFTTTNTTFTDITGLSVTITPKFVSSKILVIGSCNIGSVTSTSNAHLRFVRDSTAIAVGDAAGNRTQVLSYNLDNSVIFYTIAGMHLDSPATTSAVSYKFQVRSNVASQSVFVNRSSTDSDLSTYGRGASSITVMEVAG